MLTPRFLLLSELPGVSSSVPEDLDETTGSFWVESGSGAGEVRGLSLFLVLGAGWGGRPP